MFPYFCGDFRSRGFPGPVRGRTTRNPTLVVPLLFCESTPSRILPVSSISGCPSFRLRNQRPIVQTSWCYQSESFGDQYDQTTRGPYDANEWRKYRVVPCAHPSRPFVMFVFIDLDAKWLLAFQGRRGIASVVRWNLRPVIFVAAICQKLETHE